MIAQSRGERIFNFFNLILLSLIGLLALYPFWYTFVISISSAAEASSAGLHLWPGEISFTAYKMVLSNPDILTGFKNTLFRTIVGTVLTVFCVSVAAYPLARNEMPYRSRLTFFIMFTMIFSGGLVPVYLLVKSIGLMNSRWALILPIMLTAFNIIVVKNFFQSIPESLAESARIDGASEFTILTRIYMPLSKPALATIALWTSVLHWNHWFDAMLYINENSKQVLQTFLQRIVIENSTELIESGVADATATQFTPETIKAATVVVTVLPILCVYPFVQRYFTKGIMLGGVKE